MDEKQTSSPNTFARTVFGLVAGVILVVSTSLITLYVARAHFHSELCTVNGLAPASTPRLSFPTQEAEWDTTHRIHIDEKGVTLMLTDSSDRCYVMPINRNNERRTLVLVHDPLSEEMLDQLAGPHAVAYCGDAPAYLLKEVGALEQSRQKREAVNTASSADGHGSSASAGSAPAASPPSSASSAASSGSSAASSGSSAAAAAHAAPGATSASAQAAAAAAVPPGERASGLNLKYEERNPRCEDLILDCGKDGAIGQTQTCYTWINGVMFMKQECTDVNKFKIYMSKPPGRILKIAQREWKVCVERRQQGLRC